MRSTVNLQLKGARYLCMPADAWTCDGKSRSFMGVTAHWVSLKHRKYNFHELFLYYPCLLNRLMRICREDQQPWRVVDSRELIHTTGLQI